MPKKNNKNNRDQNRLVYRQGMPPSEKEAYFMPGTPLNNIQKKYCRCLLHVADDQEDWCLRDKAWFESRDGVECYNPYAVCTKSVGRKGPAFECVRHFDLDTIPASELNALADLKGKSEKDLYKVWKEERKRVETAQKGGMSWSGRDGRGDLRELNKIYKLVDLKSIARDSGLSGTSKMRKGELLGLLTRMDII